MHDDRYGFSLLTLFSIAGLYSLLIWGAVESPRARAPTISAMIADDVRMLVLYGVIVCAIAISRTGLVWRSTFYALREDAPLAYEPIKGSEDGASAVVVPTYGCYRRFIRSQSGPKAIAVLGSLQLMFFVLVGMVGLNAHPEWHYPFAICAAATGSLSELGLFLRRCEVARCNLGLNLAANLFTWLVMVTCFAVFGAYTWSDYYAEINTYVGLAEWYGFATMAAIAAFRQDDVRAYRAGCREGKCACETPHNVHQE